jgi:hypothetical protein
MGLDPDPEGGKNEALQHTDRSVGYLEMLPVRNSNVKVAV